MTFSPAKFFAACRSGIMGPVSSDVSPCITTPNTTHRRGVDAKFLRNDSATALVAFYEFGLAVSKFRVAILSAGHGCAVPHCISAVTPRVAPIKIAWLIVRRISVLVADKWPIRLLFANEGNGNQSVNQSANSNAIDAERNLLVPVMSCGLSQDARRASALVSEPSPYSGVVGNFVVRRFADCAPFFFGIRGVIHSEIILRSGQGRRLFAQLFRPVSYARLILRPQGILGTASL